jgi:hypothetical protein
MRLFVCTGLFIYCIQSAYRPLVVQVITQLSTVDAILGLNETW